MTIELKVSLGSAGGIMNKTTLGPLHTESKRRSSKPTGSITGQETTLQVVHGIAGAYSALIMGHHFLTSAC